MATNQTGQNLLVQPSGNLPDFECAGHLAIFLDDFKKWIIYSFGENYEYCKVRVA